MKLGEYQSDLGFLDISMYRLVKITYWLIMLTALPSIGCSEPNKPKSNFLIKGNRYIYTIPAEYAKNPNSILYEDSFKHDESNSTSLLVTEISETEFGSNVEILLLLFYDKSYQPETVLINASREILKQSAEVQGSASQYHYQNIFGNSIKNYYFSFDPSSVDASSLTEQDFYGRIQHGEGLNIEGMTSFPSASCQIHAVYDGILVQLTVVDSACSAENLVRFKDIQDELFNSWKSEGVNEKKA